MNWLIRLVLWSLLLCQILAWFYFMLKGGTLNKRQYLIFIAGMLAGNIGAGTESFWQGAWGTTVAQSYFFCTGVFGIYQRFKLPPR